ncbi:MAG: YaiI/YqxD family protein [Planctomycetota bacterium]|nr:YaiI/YqxD family protein [Planctomycetota bacterium]
MQIWVDADGCPVEIKELVYKTAERRKIVATFVANQILTLPTSPFVKMLLVPGGLDAADRKIVELVDAKDLVITSDIPLASDVVGKGAKALNPRGELYTDVNMGDRLATRNLVDEMRSQGQKMRGPSGFTAKHKQSFANELDKWIARKGQ